MKRLIGGYSTIKRHCSYLGQHTTSYQWQLGWLNVLWVPSFQSSMLLSWKIRILYLLICLSSLQHPYTPHLSVKDFHLTLKAKSTNAIAIDALEILPDSWWLAIKICSSSSSGTPFTCSRDLLHITYVCDIFRSRRKRVTMLELQTEKPVLLFSMASIVEIIIDSNVSKTVKI